MASQKDTITWKTLLLPIIGITAFLIYIYIFNVDIQEIISEVRTIRLDVYLLAALLSIIDTLFFSFAWRTLLRRLRVEISIAKSFLFVWFGIFVDTLVPAESVSGEIAKIYLVNKEQDGSAGETCASIVTQRMLGMSLNIITLLMGAGLLLIESLLQGILLTLILFLVTVTLAILALMLLLSGKRNWTMRIVDALINFAERITRHHWKLDRLREEVVRAIDAFHDGMIEYARAPKTMVVAFFFSSVSWIASLAVLYLTFVAIGYPQISWSAILVVSAIFAAVKSIPVGVPFEVGLPEIALTTLLIIFGVPPELAATGTVLSRLLTLWMRFGIGFVAQQWIGIKGMTAAKAGDGLLSKSQERQSI